MTKILNWATDLDPRAMEQAERVAKLPFVKEPVALMPDAHVGMGATIGSVIATDGAVIPAAVGVDLGCGMIAKQWSMTAADLPDDLSQIHSLISEAVPAGVGNGRADDDRAFHEVLSSAPDCDQRVADRAPKQLGSLGSGNHFVEIMIDEADGVWLVLHSGSRGAGNLIAQHHIGRAKGDMAKVLHAPLEDPDLSYFVEGTPEFDAYIRDMLWAQDYALANRQAMLSAIEAAVLPHMPDGFDEGGQCIQCHHNYCTREHHHGRNLWLTRKGAINARDGMLGVIPGSMATGSFIVEGRGNPKSYSSASHGAGRKMSRTKARKELTQDSLNDRMDGITWNEDPEALLDEHPEAYKDLGEVMENQKDLVSIRHSLRTVLNYKGT